ncbi:MAG: putative ABC transporter ATP-binding protein [Legionellaceae bacterium]
MLNPDHCIHFNQLELGYPKQPLLRAFNAEIQQGEFIGIFGPNGAGKSTLIRAILGLLKPLRGEIKLFNHTPGKINAQIGYLPQSRNHFQTYNLSGKMVISAGLEGYRWGLPWLNKKRQDALKEVIQWVEADSFADQPFSQLSGGQQQRLLLAQTLFNRPKLLLLDEPLSNLDPYNQDLIIRLIQKMQRELNATVLLTAHDVNPLLPVMDRVLYMARGNAALGKVQEVITSEQLSALYQMPMEVVKHAHRLFIFSQESGEFERVSH